MSSVSRPVRVRSLYLALALTLAAAIGSLATPGAARAGELRDCTNAAWADYNDCLMETTSWWVRKGCDISFQAEYVRCYASYKEDIIE